VIRALRCGSQAKRTLALLALATALVLVVLGVTGLLLALQVRGRFTAITKDSVPSILAAQNLRAQAQDMDADLANSVLENDNPGPNKENWAALRAASATTLLDDLAKAQGNITFPGECQAVAALRAAFVAYSTAAAQSEQAAAAARQGGARVGDDSNSDAVAGYERAADVLLNRIEPAVSLGAPESGGAAVPASAPAPLGPGRCALSDTSLSSAGGLYTINNDHELAAYDSGRSLVTRAAGIVIVLGLLAVVLAALLGVRLARTFHRYLNLGLLVAGLLALVAVLFFTVEMAGLGTNFKSVSKDALDSIRYALSIKARANAGNADESRWLFDTKQAAQWQNDFFAQRDAVNALIAQARNNITYRGERTAIDGGEQAQPGEGGLSKNWATYQQLDGQIRQAQNSGDHGQAIQLDLGPSNDAYNAFLKGVDDLQQVNQKVYSDTAATAESRAAISGIIVLALGIAAALAVLYGASRRVNEL
jgi:hypothetical protein